MTEPKDHVDAPAPKNDSPPPMRPSDVPPELWNGQSEEVKARLVALGESMAKLAEATAGIRETRNGAAALSLLIAADDIGRFADGNMLSPPDPTPEVNRVLDSQREDAKAGLVALKVEFDRLMWRAMWEHTQRQREADLARAERQREESRRERESDLERREKERQEDRARADRRHKQSVALTKAGLQTAREDLDTAKEAMSLGAARAARANLIAAIAAIVAFAALLKDCFKG